LISQGNIPTELRHTFEGGIIEMLWIQLLEIIKKEFGSM
jgi:hypothetical protein